MTHKITVNPDFDRQLENRAAEDPQVVKAPMWGQWTNYGKNEPSRSLQVSAESGRRPIHPSG